MGFITRLVDKLAPPRITRSGVSRKGIDPETAVRLSRIAAVGGLQPPAGVAGTRIIEPVPKYIRTPSEHVIRNENNSWIVLGRDRPGARTTGYGGRGETQCASIDIVAGRMSADPRQVDDDGTPLVANPNFKLDAARIYLSQKTDIDAYFGLIKGRAGDSVSKSGIGIKADAVRLVAREGIKLVTKTDARNSQGGQVHSISGIDLIAGNRDRELEPMVKGRRLITALQHLTGHVDKLNGIVNSFLMSQMEFNSFVQKHQHISPFGGPTAPSLPLLASGVSTAIRQLTQCQLSLVAHKANLGMYQIQYLNPAGNGYINSRYNHTN